MHGTKKDGDYARTAFIGINKTGKSSRMLETLESMYHFSLKHRVPPKNHRILILTRTDPDAYKGIPRLTNYEQLRKLNSGIALFWDFETEPKKMIRTIIDMIGKDSKTGKQTLQNGAIIFEDCASYIEHRPPNSVQQFLEDHRMYHLDLFFTVHSFFDLSAFIRRRVQYVRVFKTLDEMGPNDLSDIRYPNGKSIYRAWVEVMNSPNNYENLVIKTGQ